MVFGLFGKKNLLAANPELAAVLAEMEAMTGAATRAKELPAWALLLRSPYKSYSEPTSWLGGIPHVPPGFDWPIGKDGLPLHFIAQIDLAALEPEPSTGTGAPGLPSEGALLAFVGDGYAVRVISAHDMALAVPATMPPTMAPLTDYGFWGERPTFNRWPVDPVAYVSRGEERPDFLPDPFATPQQWITTWGLAALEASVVHHGLELELRHGREFMDWRRKQEAQGNALPSPDHIKGRIAHCALMEELAPPLLEALEAWRATAISHPAEAPVDAAALAAIIAKRTQLSRAMENNFGAQPLLEGSARAVWEKILADTPGPRDDKDFAAIAPAYRPFIEAWITDWRGHRLFGLEPEFPNNQEDLRHQNPLISIAADYLLGTESEHDYGFSIWLNDDDLARGRHSDGQFIRHCAV